MSALTLSPEEIADQTLRSFNDKWRNNPSLATSQTLDSSSSINAWIMERNGWMTVEGLRKLLASKRRILDAGCGNGRVTALLATLAPHAEIVGVDIVDLGSARQNTSRFHNVNLNNLNLRESLGTLGTFDFIYCQEVLHHTGDAEVSFKNLVETLGPGGEIAIYVYRQKAAAREFMDDHVRSLIAGKNYDEAMTICRQIAEFGRELSAVTTQVNIDGIPALGIEKGLFTPQRVLYNFFFKCYWNSALTLEENAVINYDWYHPSHCSRHTLPEVKSWMEKTALDVTWEFQDLYGITMHGRHR
jgi:SAM-dependent methyltransferase